MDAQTIFTALIVAAIGYGLGFFSCAMLAMSVEIDGDAARHAPAVTLIETLNHRVQRYRVALVAVFFLMLVGMVLLEWRHM